MAGVAKVLEDMMTAPIIVRSEDIWNLHTQIGARSAVAPRVALNQAIKWVRQKSTTAEGEARILLWDLSRLRGLCWTVPRFKRLGKGQYGEWFPYEPCPVEFMPLLAQLPEANLRELCQRKECLRGIALVAAGAMFWVVIPR